MVNAWVPGAGFSQFDRDGNPSTGYSRFNRGDYTRLNRQSRDSRWWRGPDPAINSLAGQPLGWDWQQYGFKDIAPQEKTHKKKVKEKREYEEEDPLGARRTRDVRPPGTPEDQGAPTQTEMGPGALDKHRTYLRGDVNEKSSPVFGGSISSGGPRGAVGSHDPSMGRVTINQDWQDRGLPYPNAIDTTATTGAIGRPVRAVGTHVRGELAMPSDRSSSRRAGMAGRSRLGVRQDLATGNAPGATAPWMTPYSG